MKTLLFNERCLSSGVCFDDETMDVELLPVARSAVNNIRLIPEDMIVKYTDENGEETTLKAKKGNIVVTFYEKDFPNKLILIKSKEWANNITTYEKKRDERNKAVLAPCDDCCDCACSSC